MAFTPDDHRNFSTSTVAVAPSPATSGTSLTLATGHGSRMPTAPFNITLKPANDQPDDSNAEIGRVTNVTGDVLTFTRAQEGTTEKAVAAGWSVYVAITDKTLTDIETAISDLESSAYSNGDMVNSMLSTGLVACEGMSINADPTKYDIGVVVADFVDHHTDPFNPTYQRLTFGPFTGITTPYLASHDETYVGINSSGVVVHKTSQFDAVELRDIVVLGAISHAGRTEVEDTDIEPFLVTTMASTVMDYIVNRGSFNIEGNEYTPASTNLTIKRSPGKTFDLAGNYAASIKSPNIIETAEANPDAEIYYYYRDTGGAWVNDGSAVGTIDPNYYDGGIGIGKAAVPTGKWTIQPIFLYAPWVTTDIQYGQTIYDTYEAAQADLRGSFIINPWIGNWDTFRAWLIVQEGCTDLSNAATAVFIFAGREGLVSGISGGGGGEINTASNIGTSGVGVFAGKSGVDLQFKNLKALSGKLTIVDTPAENTIDIDVTMTTADVLDSADKRYVTDANLVVLGNTSGTNTGDAATPPETTTTIGTLVNGATAKTTPVDADNLLITDSTVSHVARKVTWANIKATLKTYFDTLYNLYSHPNHSGDVTSAGDGAQTLAITAITGKTAVTAVGTDYLLISDTSDGGNLKKALASDLSGAGGSPGGSTGQVQYNNAGAFGGAAQVTITAEGNLNLGANTPSIPASGLTVFNRALATRNMLAFTGPSGLMIRTQPFIASANFRWWQPTGNSTTVWVTVNLGVSPTGTVAGRNIATTNLFTSVARVGWTTSTTAGSSAGLRHAQLQFWRGNAAGLGGFHAVWRFGSSDAATVAQRRQFVGLRNSTSVIGNVNPTTLTNIIGIGCDSGQTTLRIMHNDASGVATAIDLGANFPSKTLSVDMYHFELFAKPNGTAVGYYVERLNTGHVAEGTITTDLPANTVLLSEECWWNNGTTALACGTDLAFRGIETDF